MIVIYICSLSNIIDWLQNHLLACPFKLITGIDCPGCGFQRSLLALFDGKFALSWQLYPPTLPILLLLISFMVLPKIRLKHQTAILKALTIVVGNFILLTYLQKMFFS